MNPQSANFGNWIRVRIIAGFLISGLVFIGLSAILPVMFVRILLLLVAGILLAISAYLTYVYIQFSDRGGGIQRKLWGLVIEFLDWDGSGRVIDIGTGNGPLAILLAAKHPEAQVTGIDYWGSAWEYSQQVCEQNASAMGVAQRTSFLKASASSLPFEEGAFDAAISHFVFHEVADTLDKRDVIREALRVVRKGGAFAFQDMFLNRELYGDPEALLETIRGWGIDEVRLVDTRTKLKLPRLLQNPRVLGYAAVIYGQK